MTAYDSLCIILNCYFFVYRRVPSQSRDTAAPPRARLSHSYTNVKPIGDHKAHKGHAGSLSIHAGHGQP